MVRMDVSVNEKANITVRHFTDGRDNTIRQRSELVVDHNDPVFTNREADVPSTTL